MTAETESLADKFRWYFRECGFPGTYTAEFINEVDKSIKQVEAMQSRLAQAEQELASVKDVLHFIQHINRDGKGPEAYSILLKERDTLRAGVSGYQDRIQALLSRYDKAEARNVELCAEVERLNGRLDGIYRVWDNRHFTYENESGVVKLTLQEASIIINHLFGPVQPKGSPKMQCDDWVGDDSTQQGD